MRKSIPERIDAIVTVLERLAVDVEVIREGVEILAQTLPCSCEAHCHLLATQSEALKRISIGLGMVQHAAASLGEIREYAEAIMEETQALVLAKNGLDMVLAQGRPVEAWYPLMVERASCRFQHCVARIRAKAALLTRETQETMKRSERSTHPPSSQTSKSPGL